MTADTSGQFDSAIKACKDIFLAKMKDYGTAWRVLRPESLTDQIYIKANRIRSIQGKGTHLVIEDEWPEFIGIINYAIIALIQLESGNSDDVQADPQEIENRYDYYVNAAKSLMMDKNHDYDEAWRNMRVSSLTDIILMKLLRVKQIEDNKGKTFISEGVDANYYDMINYAVFALIKLAEQRNSKN
jgi:Nucleotide modification associated domain 1